MQWGFLTPSTNNWVHDINLLLAYSTNKYSISLTGRGLDEINYELDAYTVFFKEKTKTSFKAAHSYSDTTPFYWRTYGCV